MKRAFSIIKPKINFSYESLRKSKRFKLMLMFGIGLGGAGLSIYSKYFNSEIDVVYNDCDLMDAIVPRVPALFKVAPEYLAILRHQLLAFPLHGDHLLRGGRTKALCEDQRRTHPDSARRHSRARYVALNRLGRSLSSSGRSGFARTPSSDRSWASQRSKQLQVHGSHLGPASIGGFSASV